MNSSLASSYVPSQWKKAIVVPVPKVTPTPSMNKLRPISLTCTLSKVCESFVMRWMMHDMSPSLDTMQFGNRKGRSTTHYLADLVHFVLSEVELGRYVNLLMIDYSKAFDKVDITVALEKLLSMNLRPALLNWVGNFLSERQQCVKVGATFSAWTPTSCGVPQGTKVGPVVFLEMVNQVASSAPKRWKYVDDITAGESCSVSSTRPSTLQDIMDNICADAARDNMSLNVDKCSTMQFHVSRSAPPIPKIQANGQLVPFVTSIQLLGITLQSSLRWDAHINGITAKANSKRYFLLVLKRAGISAPDLIKFYTTFVRPTLEYAAPVWHASISYALSDKLEGVQRSSLKTIYPDLSYRLACQRTGLATLRDRRVSLCKSFAKSSLKNPDFQHWFPKKRGNCHSYHLRNNHQRTVPFNRTKRLDKSPINFMLSLINSS